MTRLRPRSCIAIDGIGDKPGAGRGIVGLCASGRQPKVPLPKPRPIARNVVPKTTPVATAAAQNAAPIAVNAPVAPVLAPATRQPAALPPPPRRPVGTGCDRRDVVDLAGRYRSAGKRHRTGAQAQVRRCDAGAGRDIRSGREETRRMDHPAQRQQRRVGRALSRLHRGQSKLALADFPAPAPRGGAVGRPSRRRRGLGDGSKTNRRCRPRASSRWRAP